MASAVLRRIAPVRAIPTTLHPAYALALSLISLSFGGIHALPEVSFQVAQSEIRAMIGPNGAGKSSVLNVISGLYQADSGSLVLGVKVFRLPNARAENGAIADQVTEISARLDLTTHLNCQVSNLSHGLQKWVKLARALVARSKLLLLDKPMAGMPATEKAEMAGYIGATRDTIGLSVILSEHDIGVVMGLSDRVVVLDYGRKISDGTPAEVQRDPCVIRAYLGQEAA